MFRDVDTLVRIPQLLLGAVDGIADFAAVEAHDDGSHLVLATRLEPVSDGDVLRNDPDTAKRP